MDIDSRWDSRKNRRFPLSKEPPMSVGLYFRPAGFTPGHYDNVLKQLEQAGAGFGSVPGRTFHCAMEVDGAIHVFDVWESMEQFQKFGETLLPIMKKVGVDPGQPQVMTVHNVRNG
jgi:hypothetical protein